MLSVIAGGLMFIAMTYIGVLVRNQYALRLKFLKYILDFATFMQREVTLYKTPVNSIIVKFSTIDNNDKIPILNDYVSLKDKTHKNIYNLTNYIYLKLIDREKITDFLFNMGKGNYLEEKKYIEHFINEMNLLRDDATEALAKDGKLYSQLLALVGIALMIIIV